MDESRLFSERLNTVMKERCLTPGMVAIKTGISERMIRNYRKGANTPGLYSLLILAKALDVDMNWLGGFEEEK